METTIFRGQGMEAIDDVLGRVMPKHSAEKGRSTPLPARGAEELRRWREEVRLQEAGIPKRFQAASFDAYVVRHQDATTARARSKILDVCRAYAAGFAEHAACGRSLIFTGAPGTGKTMLACAIAREIMWAGRTAKYATAYQLAREVKDTYGRRGASEQEVSAGYISPDLLVLDEIGMQFGTDAERLALWDVLNGRYERVVPTILVSNLTVDEMAAYVSDRVIDRMRENGGAVLAFTWDSFRQGGAA